MAGRSAESDDIKHLTINGRSYALPFADLLRPLTALEFGALDAAIAAEDEILLPVQTYLSALYGESLLDGQNRARIGEARGLEIPLLCRGRMTEDRAKRRALALNVPRRHLTLTEQAEQRGERIAKVVESKEGGKSNRAIAAEVGVSESQIRLDLARAVELGAQACAPGPVTGTDGKEYPPPKARRRQPRKTSAQKTRQAGLELAKLLKKETSKGHLLDRLTILAAVYGVPFSGRTWPALEGVLCTLRDYAMPTATA